MPDKADSPVSAPSAARRIGELDILRGFALFGIVVVNTLVVSAMFAPGAGAGDAPRVPGGVVDRICGGLEGAFFDGKFYLLFAFLFGYSFTLQMAAAERAGVPAVPRLLRRSAALFLVGVAHVTLLWLGDILTAYAALCAMLVALRTIRARTALIAGLLLYVAFSLLPLVQGGKPVTLNTVPRTDVGFTGGFTETLASQVAAAPHYMLQIWQFQGVPALGMFLIGFAAGKRKVFEDPELLRRWTPRALALGFVVGVPVSLASFGYSMVDTPPPALWPTLQVLVNPFLTLGYIAALVRLSRSAYADAVARLAPAGRMAASNYIGQSVVCMLIYSGYGLALAGKVPTAGVMAIATATFATQVWLSARWLRRHAYGPVEWVLRAATNLSVPTWRTPARG
ncbi:DUF418 domain-containing protein [Nocardia nova]|uniref:DUF418 domain-containing protein n=1 Tax=Nocardia nova TaxID=37330 RepID=UPI001895C0CB|nr:DUF418 domain-containing protein [Nocardia nova]MBF6149577.1 DUF418 domain-containing protein [Nocardia nova]